MNQESYKWQQDYGKNRQIPLEQPKDYPVN
jgi:hypothetical protein